MKRYYVYDFLIGSPILIDTKDKTVVFYKKNMYGQIYNLDEEPQKITGHRINGLIKRLNGYYSFSNSLAIDGYIYHHIMTEDQKNRCQIEADKPREREFITSGDNLKEVIEKMCIWVFENESSDKENEELKFYYKRYLADKIA